MFFYEFQLLVIGRVTGGLTPRNVGLVLNQLEFSLMLSLRKEPTFSVAPTGATVVRNAKLPWPAKIDLPTNFRPEVARALQEKDPGKFTTKMRKGFIARIYEYFARYAL